MAVEISAKLKYLHIAPRKARLAAGVIKGMESGEAERQLRHGTRRAFGPLLKLLRSAVAGARHDFRLSGGQLTIKDIRVDPGPTATKYRPRAFGRAAPIRRRTSHVTLILEVEGEAMSPAPRTEAPAVREADARDLEREEERRPAAGRAEKTRGFKPRVPGFIRRIFQRKAI